jgi:3-methyladenine DNA glycosylase AlkD
LCNKECHIFNECGILVLKNIFYNLTTVIFAKAWLNKVQSPEVCDATADAIKYKSRLPKKQLQILKNYGKNF